MRLSFPRAALLIAGGLLFQVRAQALVFQEYVDPQGNHVLVARDCKNWSRNIEPWGSFDKQHGCRGGADDEGVEGPGENYLGDGVTLDYILSLSEGRSFAFNDLLAVAGGVGSDAGTAQTVAAQLHQRHAFAQVWLNSGGGNVNAGIAMARVLRRHGMTVRVPSNYQCISACTIAFMGGVIRLMDDDAAFRVHSASSVEEGVDKKLAARLAASPDAALWRDAREQQIDSRYMALRLLVLFQNTLLIPTRSPQQAENDSNFCEWAGGEWVVEGRFSGCMESDTARTGSHFPYLDPDNPQRSADVARIRREGPAAYQDILMRIERDSMALAISDIEVTLPQRGLRAKAALNMIRAMYMTSITDTSYMTKNQMVTLGYLTPIFDPDKN